MNASKAKCSVCDKVKDGMQYSKNQLKAWEGRVRNSGLKRAKGPICRGCTGEPQTEFECNQCQKVMGRAKFAKGQLKKSGAGFCEDCSQERQDREPNPRNAEEEESIYEDMTNQNGGEESVWTTPRVGLALPSLTNSSMPSTSHSRAGDGVLIQDNVSQVSRSTARLSDSSSETATQFGGASIMSRSSAGWSSIQPIERTHRGPGRAGYPQGAGDRFAKQGAVKKDAQQRAWERYDRNAKAEKAKQAQKPVAEDEYDESEDDRDDDSDDGSDFEL